MKGFFKRKKRAEGMSKGAALIAARRILGPDAQVRTTNGEHSIILSYTGGEHFWSGHDWESALAGAAGSNAAVEWSDKQIDQGNTIALAEDNLKKARKEIGEKNLKGFVSNLQEEIKKKFQNKLKHAEEYQLWKEGREEEYQAAVQRTKLLATMEPAERVTFLNEEKRVAKELRRLEYTSL